MTDDTSEYLAQFSNLSYDERRKARYALLPWMRVWTQLQLRDLADTVPHLGDEDAARTLLLVRHFLPRGAA